MGSGGDQMGKRPRPTIEGTATEVAVEPAVDEDTSEPKTEAADTKGDLLSDDSIGGESQQNAEAGKPAAAEKSGRTGDKDERSLGAVLLGILTSFLTHAVAGLAGGIAVLVAIAWASWPLTEPPIPPDITPLENRIAQLEAAPQTPDNSADLERLEARLGELESSTPETPPETPPEIAALDGRVAQLETSLKSMAEAAEEGGSVRDAAAISQQIGEAEKRLESKIATALIEAAADTTAIEALRQELAAIEARLRALTAAELGSGDAAQLAPEIAELDDRLGRIESALPALLDAVEEEAADTKTATLAIAFAGLRAAVNEGRPYTAELATLAALSPGAGGLGALLDYEDTGIPTLRQLTVSFEEAQDTALAATTSGGDVSLLDRLMASAESLIKVRRVDADAEGDTPGAVLARAAAQLEQGDLASAATEVETLQGAPRAAFAKWLDAAKARLDAEAALQRLQNILLVSLGGSGARGVDQTEEQD